MLHVARMAFRTYCSCFFFSYKKIYNLTYFTSLFSFFHSSVLFGDDASSSCGVEVKSVFFQDSVQLSGFVVSATLHFHHFFFLILEYTEISLV